MVYSKMQEGKKDFHVYHGIVKQKKGRTYRDGKFSAYQCILFIIHLFDCTGSQLRHVESFSGCTMRILIAAYEIQFPNQRSKPGLSALAESQPLDHQGRTCTHLLLQECQNHNYQQENVGTHQEKETPHPRTEQKPQRGGRRGKITLKSNPKPAGWVTHKWENKKSKEVLTLLQTFQAPHETSQPGDSAKGLGIPRESDSEGQQDLITELPQDWGKQILGRHKQSLSQSIYTAKSKNSEGGSSHPLIKRLQYRPYQDSGRTTSNTTQRLPGPVISTGPTSSGPGWERKTWSPPPMGASQKMTW